MENKNFEVGSQYHVADGRLCFTGVLLDVFDDGTGLFQSIGTGSTYRLELSFAHKL